MGGVGRDGACAQRCGAAGVTERLGRGSYDHSIPLPAPRSHKTTNVFPTRESWKSRRWEHRYSLRALPSPKPPANALSPRGLQTPEAQAWGGGWGSRGAEGTRGLRLPCPAPHC